MSHQTDGANRQAIVIGASIGGLLAARVLAGHFGQVTLLERDTFPEPGGNRKGVLQGQHKHLLLERGRAVMEGYLPGLTDELAARPGPSSSPTPAAMCAGSTTAATINLAIAA